MSIVLVHGRCLTGAVWDLVTDELRGRGRRVEVVELHRGSLLADTAAVQDVVDLHGEPIVVCGWSYGGMVITGLALGASSHLVYLCALMPAEGESAIELGSRHPGGLAALVDTDEAGDLVLRGDQLDEILWADAPSETAAMARTMLRPQAMRSFREAPPRVAWRQTPSTYVVGRHDRAFHRELVDEMASRAASVIEWDTSHSPLLSRPDLVGDLLARIDAGQFQEPTRRDGWVMAAAERAANRMTPGDLVCFPSGQLGAHPLKGPGRLVIFATGHDVEPYMSVYPDSDKVSGPEGILLRGSAVGYQHGEGTAGPSEPVDVVREPMRSPPQPAVNALALRGEAADLHAPTGFRYRAARLGPLLGAERIDGTVVDVDPGEGSEPYHYVHGREEWMLVLAGAPTLRHPHGENRLEAGDLVCLPEGPSGAHRLLNRGESVVRALLLSTTGVPANVCYPDTGHWLIRNGRGRDGIVVRETGPLGADTASPARWMSARSS